MKRWAASLLLLSACHTAGPADIGQGPERTPSRIHARTGTYNATTYDNQTPVVIQVLVAPEEAWAALPGAYEALGIEVNAAETATRRMGNTGFRVRRELGSESLSTYLDCGSTIGGVNANTHQVTLYVMTTVEPAASGSSLSVQVAASASPLATTGSVVDCTPTGRLEQRIAERVARTG